MRKSTWIFFSARILKNQVFQMKKKKCLALLSQHENESLTPSHHWTVVKQGLSVFYFLSWKIQAKLWEFK